jgi:hypothetical protein
VGAGVVQAALALLCWGEDSTRDGAGTPAYFSFFRLECAEARPLTKWFPEWSRTTMRRFTLENRPPDLLDHLKTAIVSLLFMAEPFEVETQEGVQLISPETVDKWEGGYFLAYPGDGSKPYAIAPSYVRENYTPAGGAGGGAMAGVITPAGLRKQLVETINNLATAPGWGRSIANDVNLVTEAVITRLGELGVIRAATPAETEAGKSAGRGR